VNYELRAVTMSRMDEGVPAGDEPGRPMPGTQSGEVDSKLSAHGSELTAPSISVVIPARNEEAYLAAAMRSVAEQHYPAASFECIVVDNGSTDGTFAVASSFGQAARDGGEDAPSMRVESELVPSVGGAKNRGASVARGDILIFLDADSRMDPDLARDVAACRQAGHPAGSIRIVADSTHPLDRGFFALMEVGKVFFGIRSQMMYCDRQLFLSLGGFDPTLHLGEDLEFLKRVKACVRASDTGAVCHVSSSSIRTSPRRLRTLPFHLGMIPMFWRWLLAFLGLGRTRRY
jgi:glycosyltransferase involved in cell wall biosynthesis